MCSTNHDTEPTPVWKSVLLSKVVIVTKILSPKRPK